MLTLPPNIHVISTEWLASKLGEVPPEYVIEGFPEHGTKLDPDQRYQLYRAASAIVRSFGDSMHVGAVLVLGHADTARNVPVGQRAKFELGISQMRAKGAAELLRNEMNRLATDRKNGPPDFITRLPIKPLGVGSTKKRVNDAKTEWGMRQNRRVEIRLAYVVTLER